MCLAYLPKAYGITKPNMDWIKRLRVKEYGFNPAINNEKVLTEASQRGVVLYNPNGTEVPSFSQWDACRQDLDSMPWEVIWSLQYMGRPLVMTNDRPCTDYPLYSNLKNKPVFGLDATYTSALGIGWPLPIFRISKAYPIFDSGIGYAGLSVPIHEVGHAIDMFLNGATGDPSKPPFSSQPWWKSVHASINWGASDLDKTSPVEAFADSFATWCLSRQSGGWHRLPWDVDKKIMAFWDTVAKMAGWTSVAKPKVTSTLSPPKRKVSNLIDGAMQVAERSKHPA